MTDLELTKACAAAMGFVSVRVMPRRGLFTESAVWFSRQSADADHLIYDPLHDDAQAFQLVKKFFLWIENYGEVWIVSHPNIPPTQGSINLNKAICECVAQMQRKLD